MQAHDQVEIRNILPQEGFVIKTADLGGSKVFINICSSAAVPAPKSWDGAEIPAETREALGKGIRGDKCLGIVLGQGKARQDSDHVGAVCKTFDVICNDDVLRAAQQEKALRVFIIRLAMRSISESGEQLQDGFKVPKMRYKGRIGAQDVSWLSCAEGKNQAMRSQSNTAQGNGSTNRQSPQSTSGGVAKPGQHSKPLMEEVKPEDSSLQGQLSYQITYAGQPIHSMTVTVRSKHGSSMAGCTVHIQGDQLYVTSRDLVPLEICLPFGVDRTRCRGHFEGEELILGLPYAPIRAVWNQV